MDTTITSEAPASETAVTETPEQSTGTGTAAPETQSTDNGSPQGRTEGDQTEAGGKRKWSMQDEVKELRAQRRELRERLSSSDSVREELAQLREELNRLRQPKSEKAPENFWQNPEARLQALRDELKDIVAEQNSGLMQAFHQTREQEFQQQALRQETDSATEFIRTQPGYHPDDDDDLIEIITENGLSNLGPTRAAKTAWALLQQTRGVGDRHIAKQRASGVQGQPPGQGFGRKMWNKSEFDAACDMLEKNPHDPKNAELLRELEAAHKEGRVK